MKKIFVVAVLSFLLISCGKKADPEYKAKKNNIFITKI